MLDCDATLEGDNPCQGLNNVHPDVSIYDKISAESDIDVPVATSLLRLSFHDCAEVDPYYVSLGETSYFSDSDTNGYIGGCNGCIGIDNDINDNLLEGAIELMEPICVEFSDVISRADCWMLASTLAAEFLASGVLDTLRVKYYYTAWIQLIFFFYFFQSEQTKHKYSVCRVNGT